MQYINKATLQNIQEPKTDVLVIINAYDSDKKSDKTTLDFDEWLDVILFTNGQKRIR